MSAATRGLARSIRRTAHDVSDRKPELVVAVIRKLEPLEAEVTDSRQKLTEDDLLFAQGVRRYDSDIGLEKGDSLVVTPLRNGDWVAHEVLSDHEPPANSDAEEVAKAEVEAEAAARAAAVEAEREAREAAITSVSSAAAPLILVRAATTAALPANTAPTTKTLEASANGLLTSQDGVSLVVGDRLLVKNEATGSKNGVYEVTSRGSASAKWKLTRVVSMNESSKVVPGMKVVVAQGTLNGSVTFQLLTTGSIALGITTLTFGYAVEWATLPGAAGWENFAGEFSLARYRKGPDNWVQIRGLVKHLGSLTNGVLSLMATLPTGFRPSATEIFTFWGAAAGSPAVAMRIDVRPNGEVSYYPLATGAAEYVPLTQIGFYAD